VCVCMPYIYIYINVFPSVGGCFFDGSVSRSLTSARIAHDDEDKRLSGTQIQAPRNTVDINKENWIRNGKRLGYCDATQATRRDEKIIDFNWRQLEILPAVHGWSDGTATLLSLTRVRAETGKNPRSPTRGVDLLSLSRW